MYKVFINDNSFFFTNEKLNDNTFIVFSLEEVNFKKIVSKLYRNKIQKACVFHPDEREIMNLFKEEIPINKAGGGLVYNKNREVLFIFRNGKWDLPKGGIKRKETKEDAAIREVGEETGVTGLSIVKKLEKTYHIFKRNGKHRLKITYWYEMQTDYDGALTGQLEEGIEKVAWLNPTQIQEALKNSYENIKLLFSEEEVARDE